ncbi:MAG: T9SS type A sorting domain-containing protein, partial [Bacteroidales bacterium]|nr:T9SS type A sorting domain-containing protein [Bacteroidales bacterium]
TVTKSNYTDFENIEVAPSKGNFSRQINPNDVDFVYGEMYQQDAFYPSQQASLESPYILRDFRGQNLMVYPYAYNPVTKTLRVYSELRLVVKKVSDDGENQKVSRRSNVITLDSERAASYERRFINFNQQSKYEFLEEIGEMLVVYVDELADAVEDLVEWKNISGRQTTMVPVSQTGTEGALKSYIQNYYSENPNLTSLLLIGEHDALPPYPITLGNGISAKTDNYYGMLEGDDFYEEIFVGRLSVIDAQDAANQINKIIYYERDINTSASWLSRGIGIGSIQGNGHYGEKDYEHIDLIRDTLMNYTYTEISQRYDGVNYNYVAADDIEDDIENGVGIANYCNHGTSTSWVVGGFNVDYVNGLKNDNMLPFIWSSACYNGQFNVDECFAEAWMRARNNATDKPTGAIGGMFSWISQPWIPPMYGQDEMVAILTEWREGYKHTLGGASLNGNMYILDMCPTDEGDTHNTWILFGDPSMMLRTKAPESMNVVCNEAIMMGMTEMLVEANADYGIATLSKDGEVIASTNIENNQARLTFSPLAESGKLKLVVIGYNKTTYERDIEVIATEGAHVVYTAFDINQEDGQVDYGEVIDLSLTVKNIGIEDVDNVNIEIVPNSNYVAMLDNNSTVASMPVQEIVALDKAFQFVVSNEVPDQTVLSFTVKCSSSTAEWTSSFDLIANAPVIRFVGVGIESDEEVLNPGVTAALRLEIINEGNSDVNNVITELFSSSSEVEFENATVETESIEVKETVVVIANFSVASSAVIGSTYEISYSVSSGYYIYQDTYSVNVGNAFDGFESGDFSTLAWEFAGESEWTIYNDAPFEGSFCARSGDIEDDESSSLILTLDLPADGELSFHKKLHCDYYDKLFFYIDGVEVAMWRGNNGTIVDWEQYTCYMTKGTHTIEWKYKKDVCDSFGADFVYLDQVVLPSLNIITSLPAVENLTCTEENSVVTLSWDASEEAEEYIIKRNGEQIAVQTETTFSEELPDGLYTYNVVARNGVNYSLPSFVAIEVGNTVNVNEIFDNTLKVYPNPASDILYVDVDDNFDATIYNYQGQIVKRYYNLSSQINVSSLSSGVYFVEIKTDSNMYINKVVVK